MNDDRKERIARVIRAYDGQGRGRAASA